MSNFWCLVLSDRNRKWQTKEASGQSGAELIESAAQSSVKKTLDFKQWVGLFPFKNRVFSCKINSGLGSWCLVSTHIAVKVVQVVAVSSSLLVWGISFFLLFCLFFLTVDPFSSFSLAYIKNLTFGWHHCLQTERSFSSERPNFFTRLRSFLWISYFVIIPHIHLPPLILPDQFG